MVIKVGDVRYPIDLRNVMAYFPEKYSIKFRFVDAPGRLFEIVCPDEVSLRITMAELDKIFNELYK
jgi:hypothetical protein